MQDKQNNIFRNNVAEVSQNVWKTIGTKDINKFTENKKKNVYIMGKKEKPLSDDGRKK